MRDCCGFLQIRSHITMDTNITPLTLTDQPYRQSAPGWIITKSLGYKDVQGILILMRDHQFLDIPPFGMLEQC